MKIIKFDLKENKLLDNKKYVITLGKFKSLHKGHQLIFVSAKKISVEKNLGLIFMLYPDYDGFNDKIVDEVIPYDIRKRLLSQYKPDYLLEFEPNAKNYRISREEFLDYLKINLNVTDIVIGKNFDFGKNKADDHLLMKKNFNLKIIPLLKYNNQIISTTLVKDVIKNDGAVESFKKLTGFNYFFEGEVTFGKQLGTKYGTPTINVIPVEGTLKPREGIYFSKTYYKNKEYYSISSISNNPTFLDGKFSWETHIFDFNKNIYKKWVKVELIKFYREPKKFENIEELFAAIDKDKNAAKKYFKIVK